MKYFRHTLSSLALIGMASFISACGGNQTPSANTTSTSGGGNVISSPSTDPGTTPITTTPTTTIPPSTPGTTPTPSTPVQPQTSTTPDPLLPQTPDIVLPPTQIISPVLSGKVTYDRVLFGGPYYRGLDYQNIVKLPVRGVTVQLLDINDAVLATTQTDKEGGYEFNSEVNVTVRVRILAQLFGADSAAWDIEVRDNTSGNALYVVDGGLANTGSGESQTRNLHVPSGWDGAKYGTDRSAGPFAVLDSVYDAVQMVVDASPNVVLPAMTIYWSTKNIAIGGDAKKGHIGTSYFTNSGPSIYLLGAADNDSDEYDRAVIQHEFAHYIEEALGRSESVGGSHNQQSRLDMRVAFGEAWGNAFSGMAARDPLYRDSMGATQSLGFTINVEGRGRQNQGWFSEETVQAVLYDLFDAEKDAGDEIELGFKPILDAMTSDDYLKFSGFASVYSFVSELKAQQPDQINTINSLVQSYDIFGTGWYGEGETNNGGSDVTLPIYNSLELGVVTNVCSSSVFQDSNGVDVRRFLKIQIPVTRSYTIHVLKTSGPATTNPQLKILRGGAQVASLMTGTVDREDAARTLTAGTYIFEIYEQTNADGKEGNGSLACFDVSVE